jgi:glycosyltransferase involved in cell wall biosynthesis
MRIAYISTEDLSKIGGGRVHFRAIANGLADSGNSVYVVAPQYGTKPWNQFDSERIIEIRFSVPGKNAFGLFCFELFLFFMLPWFKFKYCWDALLVRGGGPAVIMGLVFLLGRMLGIRVVLECNGVTWLEFEGRGFSKLFCEYIKFAAWSQAKTASSLIGVTPAICDAYRKLANRSEKVCYPISNGVITEKFPLSHRQSIRKEYGWDSSKTVLVMPNGFSPWHGLNELIEAITLLPPRYRANIRCVLPGDGEMFADIKERISKLGLVGCVALPGQLGREEIYRILAGADVGLLLRPDSTKQNISFPGSPLKLFEYFGAGLPVIATSDCYHSKLIPYYSLGVVLESMTPQALAQAIIKFADKTAGDFDRQHILNTAKGEFHWKKVSQRVLAVLQNTEPVLEKWLQEGSELSK